MSFIRRPSENYCPGIEEFVRPTVSYVKCKICGGRVEVWSDEDEGVCLDCGARGEKIENKPSCLEYCEYAAVCKGIIMSKKKTAK